jgi:acyl-CoA synthetase (NDP forming)
MDISETDFLEYMGQDSTIDVIAMYMEDVSSGKRFADVAGRVSCRKPVIVLKTGRTEAGKKAVSSHTASLAGNDEINNAALGSAGSSGPGQRATFSLFEASPAPLPKDPRHGRDLHGITGRGSNDMLYSNVSSSRVRSRAKEHSPP